MRKRRKSCPQSTTHFSRHEEVLGSQCNYLSVKGAKNFELVITFREACKRREKRKRKRKRKEIKRKKEVRSKKRKPRDKRKRRGE